MCKEWTLFFQIHILYLLVTKRQAPSFHICQRLNFNPPIYFFFYPLPLGAPQIDLRSWNFLPMLLIVMYKKVHFPRSISGFTAGPIRVQIFTIPRRVPTIHFFSLKNSFWSAVLKVLPDHCDHLQNQKYPDGIAFKMTTP